MIWKQLEENTIEALISAWFEANKSKEWFKKQLDIKKTEFRAEESNTAMKRMMKAEKVMKDIEINQSSS